MILGPNARLRKDVGWKCETFVPFACGGWTVVHHVNEKFPLVGVTNENCNACGDREGASGRLDEKSRQALGTDAANTALREVVDGLERSRPGEVAFPGYCSDDVSKEESGVVADSQGDRSQITMPGFASQCMYAVGFCYWARHPRGILANFFKADTNIAILYEFGRLCQTVQLGCTVRCKLHVPVDTPADSSFSPTRSSNSPFSLVQAPQVGAPAIRSTSGDHRHDPARSLPSYQMGNPARQKPTPQPSSFPRVVDDTIPKTRAVDNDLTNTNAPKMRRRSRAMCRAQTG
ncbi:hypothetical protein L210DRAFT_2476023 [Boletus edulis BED1]|uniref:Uncharacterized protein n=1 Tax=Boletus edulis BED1 TaxID=1328754 RepID=A0AAD4BPX1_BOLED|nr:hypothetical protein L210DRAFT_2476023 [Boletus edulis BED1]